jgi:signal transduction histidine kinase
VTVRINEGRHPTGVESAAYFVVAEALTNVAKYADASEVVISAAIEHGSLVLQVSDDGVGGADPSGGTGLRGLEDRVAAVGGSLAVTSTQEAGTTVRAEFPLIV